MPGVVLRNVISSDRQETRAVRGSGWSSEGGPSSFTVQVPTGRIIEGDPSAGFFVMLLWWAAYPFGYCYWPTFLGEQTVDLTGFPNVDWTLLHIVFPIGALVAIATAIHVVRRSKGFLAQAVALLWKVLIGSAFLNLAAWLVVIAVRWLLKK